MDNVILHNKAQKALLYCKRKEKSSFDQLILSLGELSTLGLSHPQSKNIGDDIFRLRCGRWRILFTVQEEVFHIWIVALEKDTDKDYRQWKQYVLSCL